jgi:hypothetical protein
MNLVTFSASAIATFAFTRVFETSIGKYTEAALAKTDELRQKIRHELRDNPDAEQVLSAVEQGSQQDMEHLGAYLQEAMEGDEQFATEVRAIAREIDADTQDNSSMTQNIYGNSRGWETKLNGETA